MNTPKKIYLDTNMIRKLGLEFYNKEVFNNFQWMCNFFKIEICIPDICVREYLYHLKKQATKRFQKLENCLNKTNEILNCYLDKIEIECRLNLIIDTKEELEKLKEKLLKKLGDLSIRVVENIEIKQDKLIELAINKIAPFGENKDSKGFKDAVMILSVLSDIGDCSRASFCVLLSEDRGIETGIIQLSKRENIEERKLKVVTSFEELNKLLKKHFDNAIFEKFEKLNNKLFEYIKIKNVEILKFIRKYTQFNQSILYNNEFITINYIRDIDIIEIRKPEFLAKEVKGKQESYLLVKVQTNTQCKKNKPSKPETIKVGSVVDMSLPFDEIPTVKDCSKSLIDVLSTLNYDYEDRQIDIIVSVKIMFEYKRSEDWSKIEFSNFSILSSKTTSLFEFPKSFGEEMAICHE